MDSFLALYQALIKEAEQANLIEFPKDNFCVSFFPVDKHIEISPIDETKDIDGIRTLILQLRNDFEVAKVTQLDLNTFSLKFVPQQNFLNVIQFVQDQAATNNK